MERIRARGRSVKVSPSVHWVRQDPEWTRATVESGDAQRLSGALSWSLFSLSWSPGSGVSQLFSRLPRPSVDRSCCLQGFAWLNAKSVTRWSKSASTSHQDWMVYPTKCTWGRRTCFSLFWWICSNIGLPGRVVSICHRPFTGVMDLFTSSGCVSGSGSSWSEIGRTCGLR